VSVDPLCGGGTLGQVLAQSSSNPADDANSCCSFETDLKRTASIIGLDMQQIESQGGTK
jgi:hypothetical protein